MSISRRSFLGLGAAGMAAMGLSGAADTIEKRNGIPYRVLGKTGEEVSIIAVGGSHIGGADVSEEEAIRIMRTAIDEGVNFMDNAYIYKDGRSEERMGKALQDGYREKAFLMTKFYSNERDAATARRQLDESLQRLKTDYLDLWQVHQIHRAEHPRLVYENDLMSVMDEAVKAGKVRYVGFTGHSRPEYHAEMIERGYDWQTVQLPINPFDKHWLSFQEQIVPMAQKQNIGVIGMKSLGGHAQFIKEGVFTVPEALRYAMSQPVASVVCGMESMDQLEENLKVVRDFEPLSKEESQDMLAKAQPLADGRFEPFKQRELA